VGISFKTPGAAFICDTVIMAVDAAVALIPEADPVLVEELGEAAAVCGEIEDNVKEAPGLDPPN